MRHVVGLSNSLITSNTTPLDPDGRIRFDTSHQQTLGYFEIVAPSFDRFAYRDSDMSIHALHAPFRLFGNDLKVALDILENIEKQIAGRPESWRPFLGTIQYGTGPVEQMKPHLFRRRAIGILRHLRALVLKAIEQEKAVCYGSGVLYRAYCDIRISTGDEYYS